MSRARSDGGERAALLLASHVAESVAAKGGVGIHAIHDPDKAPVVPRF